MKLGFLNPKGYNLSVEVKGNHAMPKLEKITIEGYKSIKSLKDFELKDINILIGANGAGKSNFIKFFELLMYSIREGLQLYIGKKGGPDAFLHFGRKNTDKLIAKIVSGNDEYEFCLSPTDSNQMIFDYEFFSWTGGVFTPRTNVGGKGHYESVAKSKSLTERVAKYVVDRLKECRMYHFHDTGDTAKVKGISGENDNLILKGDAKNLAPYLKMLKRKYPQNYENIVYSIQRVFPPFGDFIIRENEEYIQLEWFEKGHEDSPFKAHILSDGTLRFMCLATLLLQPLNLMPDIIIIDEPELGLHPYAISILAGLIQSVASQKQFIIATQSADLLNSFSADDIIIVENEKDESNFRRLNAKDLELWRNDYSLGELWKSNLFEVFKDE